MRLFVLSCVKLLLSLSWVGRRSRSFLCCGSVVRRLLMYVSVGSTVLSFVLMWPLLCMMKLRILVGDSVFCFFFGICV